MGQLLPGARSAGVTTSGEQRPRGPDSGGAACSGPHLRAIPGGGNNILGAEPQVEVCVRFHRKKARSGSEKAGAGAAVHLPRTRAQSHPKRARLGLGAAPGSGLTARAPKPGGRRTGAIRFGLALHKGPSLQTRGPLVRTARRPSRDPASGEEACRPSGGRLRPHLLRGGAGSEAARPPRVPGRAEPGGPRPRPTPLVPRARPTHGRPPLRAPARSAHRPGLAQRGRGSPAAPARPRRGPGRAAAVGAPAAREAPPPPPSGRLPFVLEPRPRRAAVNGLGARRPPISVRPRPGPAPRPAPRAPPRAPPAPRRSGRAGRTCRGARRTPIGRPSQLGLGASQ